MINEDVRHIIEKQLDSDETLVWLTKAKGAWINRPAALGLISLLCITYYLWLNMNIEWPNFAKIILLLIIIYTVIAVFSPLFSYHVLTDKRIMETSNIPFIAIKAEMYLSANTHIERAKWLGKNSFYVKQSEVQRVNLGKYKVPMAAGISFMVLHGVVEPDKFEHIYYN